MKQFLKFKAQTSLLQTTDELTSNIRRWEKDASGGQHLGQTEFYVYVLSMSNKKEWALKLRKRREDLIVF